MKYLILLLLLLPFPVAATFTYTVPIRNVTYPTVSISSSNESNISIQETIPQEFTIISPLPFTQQGHIFIFNNTNNISYTLVPLTQNYGPYTLSGNYINSTNTTTIPSSLFYFYSPFRFLYLQYDSNSNSRIDRFELLKATQDYFNSTMPLVNITALVSKYQSNGELI